MNNKLGCGLSTFGFILFELISAYVVTFLFHGSEMAAYIVRSHLYWMGVVALVLLGLWGIFKLLFTDNRSKRRKRREEMERQ